MKIFSDLIFPKSDFVKTTPDSGTANLKLS